MVPDPITFVMVPDPVTISRFNADFDEVRMQWQLTSYEICHRTATLCVMVPDPVMLGNDMKSKKNTQVYIGLGILGLLGLFLLLGLIYHPYTATEMDSAAKLAGPTLKHWFGGDKMGRDIFTRVQQGLRTSLLISILATVIGTIGGTVIGALTGYYGGFIDDAIMRVIDVLFAIPSILLALVFVSLSDSGMVNVVLALGIALIPSFSKMMRTELEKTDPPPALAFSPGLCYNTGGNELRNNRQNEVPP